MYKVRLWAVRHAGSFQSIYNVFEKTLVFLHPAMKKVGYQRLEKPMAKLEQLCKGLLFDCKMCGQCALSATGMSCSMNCPKNLRNGPCGGVRQNGNCEVKEDMRCVWVEAWQGSQKMDKEEDNQIHIVQLPVNHAQQGSSAWLRKVKEIVQYQEPMSK
jgi:hypothetical protein